ncbi:PPC domain-containing DNA-binding protein [Desulforhopalus sp. IMCC35007]|uniref:PPC domain-containing DNA-binding protein n=1 Tax=Desulforhopalus sp. IMCC35007 TaxID=2569543 RepID=UPI0010AE7251|nr:PPC domain-containing DNA-binding protein [Desulforhopalus sp. IMCC35007]TKB09289.1 DNA-binding protein [Desulforhopalus sp. IMCC35007]
METLSLRLHPGQDLKHELDQLIENQQIKAACILTCVGSLTTAVLRFANQENSTRFDGHFEIVSLTGVMSQHGSHYHIAIADEKGTAYGAHLLEGCRIYTTAEIVIGIIADSLFLRTFDPQTGYPELEVIPQPNKKESEL